MRVSMPWLKRPPVFPEPRLRWIEVHFIVGGGWLEFSANP